MYDPYYDVVKMTTLPPDPRVKSRARRRALGTAILGVLFAFWISTCVTAATLDWRFGASPFDQIVLPWNVIGWSVAYDFGSTYPNARFDAYIHHGFFVGRIALGVGLLIAVLWVVLDYRKSMNDPMAFPNEGRDARWATPEELQSTDPTESLFPENYDIHRGFTSDHGDSRRDQRRRAANAITARKDDARKAEVS